MAVIFASAVVVATSSAPAQKFIVEDGQDPSWDTYAAYVPGYDKWLREVRAAFKQKDYRKVIELSDKFAPNHPSGVSAVYLYRAIAKENLKQYDGAKSDLMTALHKARTGRVSSPLHAVCYERLASISLKQGRTRDAQDYLRKAIRETPSEPALYDAASWLLATSPAAEMRNGREAVRLATKACELTRWNSVDSLDWLAAALAETGDFAGAVKWQSKALSLARGNRTGLEKRLALYQQRQPYRAKPITPEA